MAREFTAYVVLRDPVTGQKVTYAPGDVVPDGVNVGDHAATSAGTTRNVQTSEEAPAGDVSIVDSETGAETTIVTPEYEEDSELPPYEEWNKEDLKSEAKGRELSGYSKLTHEELVDLLKADDAENPED